MTKRSMALKDHRSLNGQPIVRMIVDSVIIRKIYQNRFSPHLKRHLLHQKLFLGANTLGSVIICCIGRLDMILIELTRQNSTFWFPCFFCCLLCIIILQYKVFSLLTRMNTRILIKPNIQLTHYQLTFMHDNLKATSTGWNLHNMYKECKTKCQFMVSHQTCSFDMVNETGQLMSQLKLLVMDGYGYQYAIEQGTKNRMDFCRTHS